jgi:hypothetical protein
VARVRERDAEELMEATPRLDAAVMVDASLSHARMLVAVVGMPAGSRRCRSLVVRMNEGSATLHPSQMKRKMDSVSS